MCKNFLDIVDLDTKNIWVNISVNRKEKIKDHKFIKLKHHK